MQNYYQSLGIYPDDTSNKSEKQLRSAAGSGDIESIRDLGIRLMIEGQRWLKEAAEQGDLIAMEAYGQLLIAMGQKKQGKKWIKIVANKVDKTKCTEQMRKLGEVLLRIGLKEQGWEWLEEAADLGDIGTMKYLGEQFIHQGNTRRGKKWLEKAIGLGDIEAMKMLGRHCIQIDDRNLPSEKGLEWLRMAAQLGDIEAMKILGKYLFTGSAVKVVRFEKEGKRWLRKAAELGDVEAMKTLGENLVIGGAVKKDAVEGKKWLVKVAERGDIDARENLGEYLINGIFLKKDIEEGKKWLLKAAEDGSEVAKRELALRLFFVEEDKDGEGRKWLEKAAETGEILSMGLLGNELLEAGEKEAGMKWLKEAYRRITAGFFPFGRRYGQYLLFEKEGYKDHELMSARINAENGKMALKRDAHLGDIESMRILGQVYMEQGDEEEGNKWARLAELFEKIKFIVEEDKKSKK
ncbi:tetratricopeptide repeat protein [Thermoflavimicrobium daqui]|nr:SEL1-like repeat protein [Thermoflavimicrobium daqui]